MAIIQYPDSHEQLHRSVFKLFCMIVQALVHIKFSANSDISPLSAMSEGANSDASNSWTSNDYDPPGEDIVLSNQFDATSFFDDEDAFSGHLSVGTSIDSDSGSSSANSRSEGSLVSDILDFDADDELEESDEDMEEENQVNHTLGKWDQLQRWVLNQIIGMYASHYELHQDGLPHGPSYLHHILTHLKTEREDHFHEALHINTTTFDALISAIEHDLIFSNNSYTS